MWTQRKATGEFIDPFHLSDLEIIIRSLLDEY